MKRFFLILTLLVLLLVLTACKTAQPDQGLDPQKFESRGESQIYVPQEGDITLLVELRTTSTWSNLKFLNQDLIKSIEMTSIIGTPDYYNLDQMGLYVDQPLETAENGDSVGLIVSYVLDAKAKNVTLDFDLTKDCLNQSMVSIYGVVEDQPRLIYQRDLTETEDCGGVAFTIGLEARLEAMKKMGGTSFIREEAVFVELESPTIQNGLEFELMTRSEMLFIEDPDLPLYEVLARMGEPTLFGHGGEYVIDLNQPTSEAELGKWMGARIRLEVDPEEQDQILEFTLHRGCINETVMNLYKVVDGERFLIPNLDHQYSTTIFECVDPLPIQVDLSQPQVVLRYYVLEKIHLDEGDQDAEGQIFLEVDLVTNSNWGEILIEDDRIISSEMLSVTGDPTRVHVKLDTLRVDQPNSSAGSALEVGVTARYGFIPGDDPIIPLKLQNGCLNQATVRFYANVKSKRIPIPLRGDQDSLTVYGCEAQDFILNMDVVQAVIHAAGLYDDLPMVAYLSDIQGEVMVRQPGMEEFFPAKEDSPVNVGGEVLTGANAEVYLTVSDGTVMRLGPNTIFGLEMGITSDEITLPRFGLQLGEMEVVSGSGGFLIYTPSSVVGAIGSAALVKVSSEGVAEMDCLAGDCFQYDGTAATADVKERLPETVAAALEVAEVQLNLSGTAEVDLDGDDDGVPDELDLCPQDGDHGYGIDAQGCPLPFINSDSSGSDGPQDWDGDGFFDFEDRCPTIYAPIDHNGSVFGNYGCPDEDWDFNGISDDNECVAGEECLDRDGDGVPDNTDACPGIPWTPSDALFQQSDDTNGCLRGDADKDGIPDDLECVDCTPPDGYPSSLDDSDGDGVPDGIDHCLDQGDAGNGVYGNFSNMRGCPIPPTVSDLDGDGVPDEDDICVDLGDAGYGVDLTGCPIPPMESDLDGDGVYDEDDTCVNLGDAGYGVDLLGCPIPPIDSDLDGFPDLDDNCPQEGDLGYGVDFRGCPILYVPYITQDWDGDGFFDFEDRCPTIYAPIDHNGSVFGNYGCPEEDWDFNGIPDDNECVAGEECLDRDGDGVSDSNDACPDIPWTPSDALFQQSDDTNGCLRGDADKDGVPDDIECETCIPPGSEMESDVCLDRDQDGICAEEDQCDFVAGSVENQGCKDGDSDGDGVRDGADLCPGNFDPLFGVTPLGCPKDVAEKEAESPADTPEGSPQPTDAITIQESLDQPQLVTDQDNDGFADDYDKCPKEGDQGYGLGRDGCPLPAPKDSDGDGVFDDQDQCPNQGDQGAGLQRNGCPMADNDPDGDGVVGTFDHCPNQGGDVGRNGCPKKETGNDPDGDGVVGDSDKCPNKGNQGYGIGRDGCPLKPPDTDGDGVIDKDDKCPGKGDLGYGLNRQGCPIEAPAAQPTQPDSITVPQLPDKEKETPPEEEKEEPPPEEKKDEPPPEEKKEDPPPEPEPTTTPT
jgi:hypothetical protein